MKKFMIYYEPGARGDFLLNAIANGNNLHDKKCEISIDLAPLYSKIHKYPFGTGWQYFGPSMRSSILIKSIDKVFTLAKNEESISIRIAANTFLECIDIAYLHHEKNSHLVDIPNEKATFDSALGVSWRESIDVLHRHRYDYVINFSDLFDIEYIKNFYFEINKQHMTEEHCNMLIENIKKQFRISRSNKRNALFNEFTQRRGRHKYANDADIYHKDIHDLINMEKNTYGILR